MDSRTLEQRAADATAAGAARHRHTELRHAALGVVAQVGEVAHADQLELVVVDAEHGIMVEVDAVHVGFDHVVANRLAETEQAIVLAQGEEMLQQARAVMGGQLAHQNGGAVGGLRRCSCLAQIFVGQCVDSLAQFERVHVKSFLVRSQIKIGTALVFCQPLFPGSVRDSGKHHLDAA
ncbi:hypothetical protein D3C72_995790 [compost metagenome]